MPLSREKDKLRKRAQRAAAALNKPPKLPKPPKPPLSEEDRAAKEAEKAAKKRQKTRKQNGTKRETRAIYNALVAAGIPKMPGTPKTPSQKTIRAMVERSPLGSRARCMEMVYAMSQEHEEKDYNLEKARLEKDKASDKERQKRRCYQAKAIVLLSPGNEEAVDFSSSEDENGVPSSASVVMDALETVEKTGKSGKPDESPKKRKAVMTAEKHKVPKPAPKTAPKSPTDKASDEELDSSLEDIAEEESEEDDSDDDEKPNDYEAEKPDDEESAILKEIANFKAPKSKLLEAIYAHVQALMEKKYGSWNPLDLKKKQNQKILFAYVDKWGYKATQENAKLFVVKMDIMKKKGKEAMATKKAATTRRGDKK